MTKKEAEEARKMREAGCTYQEIGQKYGVSRQRIHQIYSYQFKGKIASECIYQGLSDFLMKNRKGARWLLRETGLPIYENSMLNKLRGKTSFTISEVKVILAITGQTFEECFKEKETQTGGAVRESR